MPDSLGICPTFQLGPLAVPAYATLLLLALAVGVAAAWASAWRQGYHGEHTLTLVFAAFFGGVLGAKLPVWLMHAGALIGANDPLAWLSGRTIIGGLIGGTLAVLLARRVLHLTLPSGNVFAPALALALAVGRWGCLFGGCCHGKVTDAPLGVRLGDGLLHYPTQILESLFALGLFVYLKVAERRDPPPGSLWRTFMLAYFTFRFFIEFLRTDTPIAFGLTLAQLASLGVVAYYSFIARPRAGRQESAHE